MMLLRLHNYLRLHLGCLLIGRRLNLDDLIEQLKITPVRKVYIHSLNVQKAVRLLAKLEEYKIETEYSPFEYNKE